MFGAVKAIGGEPHENSGLLTYNMYTTEYVKRTIPLDSDAERA
jgi:hypothetical protein